MNLEDLKPLLGEKYDALAAHVETLTSQRDAARKESIDGRKALKAEVEALRTRNAKLMEKLGVADDDDLDALPDAKGQAEAVKQFETRVKRAERERDEALKAKEASDKLYRQSAEERAVQQALAAHQFIDADLVADYIKARVGWDGDKVIYRHGETPMALDEGVKLLVKDKPNLLKQAPAGGSGYNPAAKSNGAGIPDASVSRQKLRDRASGKPQAGA